MRDVRSWGQAAVGRWPSSLQLNPPADLPDRGRRQRDAVVVACFFALGVGLWASGAGPFGYGVLPPGSWVSLLTLICASAFQTQRSTRPGIALSGVLAVLIVDTIIGASIPAWLVMSDVAYAVALYGRPRTVRAMYLVAALITAVSITISIAVTDDWRRVFFVILLLVALMVSPIGYGRAIREHQVAAASERARAETVAQLAVAERTTAVVEERRRLARDLHDVVASHLSAIALQSAAATRTGSDPGAQAKALAAVRQSSVEALAEMRTMIDLLSADDPRDDPTSASLRRLDRLADGARSAGSPVQISGFDDALPRAVDIVGYRIVQEALANAVAHARGRPIDIALARKEATLWIDIRNDRPAAPSPGRGGHGLGNMRVRAESVGGTLTAGPIGDSWSVHAELPLTAAAS